MVILKNYEFEFMDAVEDICKTYRIKYTIDYYTIINEDDYCKVNIVLNQLFEGFNVSEHIEKILEKYYKKYSVYGYLFVIEIIKNKEYNIIFNVEEYIEDINRNYNIYDNIIFIEEILNIYNYIEMPIEKTEEKSDEELDKNKYAVLKYNKIVKNEDLNNFILKYKKIAKDEKDRYNFSKKCF